MMFASVLVAFVLTGPCDGGQCAILPRHVVSVTVEAVVKAVAVSRHGVRVIVKAPKAVVKVVAVGHQRRVDRREVRRGEGE